MVFNRETTTTAAPTGESEKIIKVKICNKVAMEMVVLDDEGARHAPKEHYTSERQAAHDSFDAPPLNKHIIRLSTAAMAQRCVC